MTALPRLPISMAAAIVFLLAGLGSTALAASQGPWVKPATDLSASGQYAQSPQITAAPDATTTAVWYRYDGSNFIIQAADRHPGESFGTPVNLSIAGQSARSPEISTAPNGTTTAVWSSSIGSDLIIQAATRQPGGSFSTPVDLSLPGEIASSPRITNAPDGTTTVVWYRSNGTKTVIQAATRPPGGSFSAPVDLSAPGQNAFNPQISAAPDGTETVVWYRFNGDNQIIQASSRPARGNFGGPVNLSDPGQNAFSPQITSAPNGTTTAIWYRSNGISNIIQAAERTPGGSFGAPVDLSLPGLSADSPQISAAHDGTATAVWRRSNGSNTIIQAATRPPGGSFGVPVDLSPLGRSADDPRIATAFDGTATAVWHRYDGSNDIAQAITTAEPTSVPPAPLPPISSTTFKLKATTRAKRGKAYKVKFDLRATNALTARRVVNVRVR